MFVFLAFVMALIIALIFAPGYRKGSYVPLIIFFLILFLAGIASRYWLVPIGPVWLGISWVPLLFIVLILTFAFVAPSPYERVSARETKENVSATTSVALSVFIWLLFSLLLIAIAIGVFLKPAY